ncbi:hypothetical protein H6S82_02415 [Planktothrix sp. FACHB-1355]|uniref:Uncharacterized protein n=1 Tax=Aerosakkonema funiforme FACHB-1375 TaxID=2949571 RepID=A0A926ZJK6_9CYAN|nr:MULTISPECIES: hypothetical protein [Oscillatoriales]MBD2185663.1 hypothetical protein [Aerosakkonema funiforme FACHB-1375]MBD3557708.1 hypothetical protein [Planktothrix sp. FACHB-1355]
MKTFILPPDDLAPICTSVDRDLLSQLQEAVSNHFYAGCDRITQTLLTQCQWSLTTNQDVPTLKIFCPDAETYWDIVGNMENISEYLSRVTQSSRIEVIPGDKKNIYFEVETGA